MFKTVLAIAAAAMAATGANATTVIYTSQAAYLAALGGTIKTEDFSSTTLVPGLSYTSNAGYISHGVFNDRVVRGSATTTFDFTPGVKGFGGTFDETPDGFGQGLSLYINGTALVSSLYEKGPGTFLGFISSTAFTSVKITAGTAGGNAETYTLDNLKFGSGAAVPEPSSWALMLAGFGLVGFAMRKRTSPAVAMAAARMIER